MKDIKVIVKFWRLLHFPMFYIILVQYAVSDLFLTVCKLVPLNSSFSFRYIRASDLTLTVCKLVPLNSFFSFGYNIASDLNLTVCKLVPLNSFFFL